MAEKCQPASHVLYAEMLIYGVKNLSEGLVKWLIQTHCNFSHNLKQQIQRKKNQTNQNRAVLEAEKLAMYLEQHVTCYPT